MVFGKDSESKVGCGTTGDWSTHNLEHELIGKEISEEEIQIMADKCSNYGKNTMGGLMELTREDMVNIYRMAR